MIKLKQSFVFLSFIFVLILGCMAVNTLADDFNFGVTEVITSGECGADGANVTYKLTSDGVFTVDGKGLMDSYSLNVNEDTGMLESTTPWKDYLDNITKVVINDGVLNVSYGGFIFCTNLKTVELADSVTRIDGYAFAACEKLTDINTANITYFGDFCLYGTSLTKLDLTGAEEIMQIAFADCASINTITFGEKLKTIGPSAFSGTSIENITIPSSVTSIWDSAFYYCKNLKSVVVPEGITSIPRDCFTNCYSLENVSLPSTLKTLESESFAYCYALKSIDLPQNLTTIGDEAFYDCNLMENITIPQGVTSIGESAFWYCSSLKSIDLPDSVTSIGRYAFYECKNLSNVVIPGSVDIIPEAAFYNCSGLKNIYIHEGVTTIGYGAFASCISLTEIDIPDSVTSIDPYAFCACSALERVVIPQNVSVISRGMFDDCTSLKSAELPKSVTSVDDYVFKNCTSLNTIYCYEDNACVNTYVDENLSGVEKKYIVEDNSIALTDLNTAGNSLNVQVDTTKLGGAIGTTPYLEAVNIIANDTAKPLTNYTYDSTEQFANFNVNYGNTSGAESVDVRGEAVTKSSNDDSVLKKYVTKAIEIVLGGN